MELIELVERKREYKEIYMTRKRNQIQNSSFQSQEQHNINEQQENEDDYYFFMDEKDDETEELKVQDDHRKEPLFIGERLRIRINEYLRYIQFFEFKRVSRETSSNLGLSPSSGEGINLNEVLS